MERSGIDRRSPALACYCSKSLVQTENIHNSALHNASYTNTVAQGVTARALRFRGIVDGPGAAFSHRGKQPAENELTELSETLFHTTYYDLYLYLNAGNSYGTARSRSATL